MFVVSVYERLCFDISVVQTGGRDPPKRPIRRHRRPCVQILYHLIQFVRLVTCDQNLRNSEFVLCLREHDQIFFS
jgi:hypothetical protein